MNQVCRAKKTRGCKAGTLALGLFVALAFLVARPSLSLALSAGTELSQAEMAKLTNRELVVHSKEISQCPWPEITVFTLIDASPAEAAALFSNYQDQKNYVPDLVRSTPTTRLGDNETVVDFEMRLPWPLANSRYSTRNTLTRVDGNGYQVSWNLVESDCLIDSKGMAQFIPYGEKTLLKYRSLIHPNGKLASAFGFKARSGVCKSVQAIATYTEETKKHNPEKVRKLVESFPK